MTICELIERLQKFPQHAKVSVEHCYQDKLGLVKWDYFDLLSIEGNNAYWVSNDVTIWIKPRRVE